MLSGVREVLLFASSRDFPVASVIMGVTDVFRDTASEEVYVSNSLPRKSTEKIRAEQKRTIKLRNRKLTGTLWRNLTFIFIELNIVFILFY